MNIEFQNTEQDYKVFYTLYIKNELRKRMPILLLVAFFVAAFASGNHIEWIKFFIIFIVTTLLLYLLFYYIAYLQSVHGMKKLIAHNRSYLDKKKLGINDEGLCIETSKQNSILKWESIISCQSNTHFIYMVLVDKKFTIIPKRAFDSDTDIINFLGIIQCGIIKARGGIAKKKPPYKLGFWCLIPLIGAFVGIWLILYGIFKYKDKWLILIGVGGVAWTVSLYSLLYYIGEY